MSARATRKRARLESSNDDDNDIRENTTQGAKELQEVTKATRTRDEEFWYDDGTVILVAGDAEFRVYKGILSEASAVFRDMFSLPQPPAPPISGDGCPIVHLSDSPEDLRHVLRVYTPKIHPSPYVTPKRPSFAAINAAARLGHKYQMTRLLDQALEYLKAFHSDDLDTWQKYDQLVPTGFAEIEAIGIVNLARFLGETSLLPTALFACCQLDRKITDGFTREDGTREQLTLDDIGLCFEAKTRLIQESVRIALRAFWPEQSETCKTGTQCRKDFKALLRKVEGRVGQMAETDPFLSPFTILKADAEGLLCQACRAMAENRISEEQRAVWARLPEILGIVKSGPAGERADDEAAGAT